MPVKFSFVRISSLKVGRTPICVSMQSVRIGVSLCSVTTRTKYNPSFLGSARTHNRLEIIFSGRSHVGEFTKSSFILWENPEYRGLISREIVSSGVANT